MTHARITEFSARPHEPDGEWYLPEGGDGSVCLERGDAALGVHRAGAGRLVTSWTGVRIRRFGSAQKGSRVFLLKYPVPLDFLYEFDAWFQYEHMPMLLEEPSWYGCEFFRALGGSCYPFAALHQLEPQALESEARNRSIDTPWWHRLKQYEWFDKQFVRTLMKPL